MRNHRHRPEAHRKDRNENLNPRFSIPSENKPAQEVDTLTAKNPAQDYIKTPTNARLTDLSFRKQKQIKIP